MENENQVVSELEAQTETQEQTPTVGQDETAKAADNDKETLKTFTQDQVNEMIRSRLERDRTSLLNRYGVNDKDGLDELIGKAQSYDIMKERFEALKSENAELAEKLAFISNGINPDREDDIRTYFKGKDIEFNGEALASALETHPEWRKVVEQDTAPKTTIIRLGTDHREVNTSETDEERMKRIFGV